MKTTFNDLQISKFKANRSVNISAMRLSDINFSSEQIAELSNIKQISLQANQFDKIPDFVFSLKELEILDISYNRLRQLDDRIGLLQKLTFLNLTGNEIEELPDSIARLSNLKKLFLSKNRIAILPKSYGLLVNLKILDIAMNPIAENPQYGSKSTEDIIMFLSSIDEYVELREAKLIFVGEGASGKTALIKRLVEDNFEPDTVTTEGIKITNWYTENEECKSFRTNIWDFGGQEIYYNTHQFFLTENSLYILVWNARTDDNDITFDYWLNTIKLLSNGAPLLIVQNKIDERIKHIDNKSLKHEFSNIENFHDVSALNGTGIKGLYENIQISLQNIEHVGKKLPKIWIDIRNELESLKLNYISKLDYLIICKKYNLTESQADVFCRDYHNLGVFLNFQDNLVLKDIVFLKPEWATNAVYKLLDNRDVVNNFGLFDFKNLEDSWSNYPSEKHVVLIELLKKFELCFQIQNTEKYIIPELLNPSHPNINWKEYNDTPSYIYDYEFMPQGIINRLIVRLHGIIYDNKYWKNGLVVKWKEFSCALIICEPLKRKISIITNKECEDTSGVLGIIQKEIFDIHKSLNNPTLKELIPCCCEYCKGSQKPYHFESKTIERANHKKVSNIQCLYSFEEVNIKTLLFNFSSKDTENDIIEMLHEISNKIDSKETLAQKANDIIQLKPNFFGLGIDLNRIINEVFRRHNNATQQAVICNAGESAILEQTNN